MDEKPPIKQQVHAKRKLIVKSQYNKSLLKILDIGAELFGNKVACSFAEEATQRIMMLPLMPDANPKNRFMQSYPTETYRNIIIKNYIIIYCVKPSEIIVLDIVHQSINPESFSLIKI